MAYRAGEIAALPFTAMGRRRLWMATRAHVWPLTFPLAFLYRRMAIRRARVMAVVGSFGKTTTTRAVAAAMGQPQRHLECGLNSRGFLAEALLRAGPRCDAIVLEVGIKRTGEMRRYARLLRPDLAVVTSIGTEHHTSLGSIAQIAHEKAEILRRLPVSGTAVLNGDDPNVFGMARETKAAVMTFGFGDGCDVRASEYRLDGASGASFDLRAAGTTRRQRTRMVGRHQVYAVLAAVAAVLAEGRDLDTACRALEELPPTSRRLMPVALRNGAVLLVDDYKTVLETVHAALAALDVFPGKKRILVLGEIFEPPGDADATYRDVGRRAARTADRAIFVGRCPAFESFARGAAEGGLRAQHAADVHEASRLARDEMASGSVVLLKGFGGQRFERIALLLAGEVVACSRATCTASLTWPCATCSHLKA